jgi:hypothetical protein
MQVGVCRKCFAEGATAEREPVRFAAACHKCKCDLKGKRHHSYAFLGVFVRVCTDCYKPKNWIAGHVCEERVTEKVGGETWATTPGGEYSWTLPSRSRTRDCKRQVDIAFQCRHATPECSGCTRALYPRKVAGLPRNGAACVICNLSCGNEAGGATKGNEDGEEAEEAEEGSYYYAQAEAAGHAEENAGADEEGDYDEFEEVICKECYEVCVLHNKGKGKGAGAGKAKKSTSDEHVESESAAT